MLHTYPTSTQGVCAMTYFDPLSCRRVLLLGFTPSPLILVFLSLLRLFRLRPWG